jgi:nicotinate-nucleotide pyrophosphorylase (carboxylating)
MTDIINSTDYISGKEIDEFLRASLVEDRADNDVTTLATVDPGIMADAVIISREKGVLAGINIALRTFTLLSEKIEVLSELRDGAALESDTVAARLKGPAGVILTGERTALNILSLMSGVATRASLLADIVGPHGIYITDTRKTIPGLRKLQKLAVLAGGGKNHRMDLAELILIKDNHIAMAGGLENAVNRAVEKNRDGLKIEVEVDNLEQLKVAVELPVDIIMLDNFVPADISQAIEIIKFRKKIEVSGGVNSGNIRDYCIKGVDYISIGDITHSAPGLDLSMEIQPIKVE